MRFKKWMLLIAYICFFLIFAYLSYSNFINENGLWISWAIVAVLAAYQIISFLIKKKKDGLNSDYVVADQRIFRKIYISLAVSYVYIILFLLIATLSLYNGLIESYSIDIIAGAIISSLFVFMISQIIQRFVN
jgi:branched-subunit amino acid transport protein AzlD